MENIKLCEVCEKIHNGSYGSGRFCSYSCRQKFSAKKGASKGGQVSKQKFGKKCQCKYCNEKFNSKLDLKKHLPKCEKRKKYNWVCPVCDEVYETRSKLYLHKHEQHYKGVHANKAIIAKLRGDEFIVSDETRKKISESSTGRKHTEESKKKISEARKKYLNEHPDKVPFKLNHSSKESYPEKYFREWLQKEGIFSEREYQVNRYTLDFAWPEKGFYLEIDGSQHALDWMKEHDIERTNFLTEKGWVCIARIFWPHFCSFNNDERVLFLKNLKNAILTSEVFHDFESEREIYKKID